MARPRPLKPTRRQVEAIYAAVAPQVERERLITQARQGDPIALYNARISDMEERRGFDRVAPLTFYRELFPVGSFERRGEYDDHRPNGIITRLTERGGVHHIITDDLDALHDPAATFGSTSGDAAYIMSPMGYSGRRPTNAGAYTAYALTVDLDGNTYDKHLDAVHQMTAARIGEMPRPTFIVSSGHGLHLYYVLSRPVALIPRAQKLLQELKRRLIYRVWNGDTSTKKKREYQGLVQGYRIVGTPSKLGAEYPVIAWRTGERVTLEYLTAMTTGFNPDDPRDKKPLINDFSVFFTCHSPTNSRISAVNSKSTKQYQLNAKCYEWYLREVRANVQAGHRYYCVMCLAIFARKCMIERAVLERDAWELFDLLNGKSDDTHGPFTAQDMRDALKMYDDPSAYKHRRQWIEDKSGFDIPGRRRNGQTRAENLEDARARKMRMIKRGDQSAIGGRPSAVDIVTDWRSEHPEGRKADCIRDTGLTKPTVYKHWNAPRLTYGDLDALCELLAEVPPKSKP